MEHIKMSFFVFSPYPSSGARALGRSWAHVPYDFVSLLAKASL
jgi:hypothetical protein